MQSFEKQKIGFIARQDLRDRSNWSGTVAALAEAVASNHEVEPLIIPHDFLEKLARGVDFLLSGGRLRNHGFFCRRYAAYQLNRILSGGGDILFSPGQSDLLALGVPGDKKLIYLSDAVFRSMIDYYWSGMDPKMEAYLDSAEAKTLERADAVILSSEWAKRDAMRFYHTPEEKIFVIPFGANLRDEYRGKDFATKKNEIKLLLVGVDWERKGIDIAIDAVLALNSMQSALRFDLTIVGFSKPAGRTFSDAVHFAGRLNKNVPAEYDRMIAYYQASDIFLLPTKAECSAIVFAEAAEYGMPVFTHRTGGVESYVSDGVTGRCLELGATGEDFARAILAMLEAGDLERYAKAAREKYEAEMNWTAWGASFEAVLAKL